MRSLCAVLTLAASAALLSAQGMPDPREIAGIPLPVGDVPAGTVTVRVIRGSLANNLPGQLVELSVDGVVQRSKTGESGRAEFSGLRAGARVKAVAVVDGERLESQEFPVPATGGIRLLLVATDPSSAGGAAAGGGVVAAPGESDPVLLGDQSRFVIEIGDRALNVFGILQIVNTAAGPVAPTEPLTFEAPANAGDVTLLNGSSPRARAQGKRVEVAGPFPPGATLVQLGYAVEYSGPDVTVEQRLPLALSQVTVLAQKVGDSRLTSQQISQQREVAAQGQNYIVGQGPGVPAGTAVSFSFTGLPHAAVWPRNLALVLAVAILAAGAWSGSRIPSADAGRGRAGLEARRDRLLSQLAALEQQRMAGAQTPQDARYSEARRELVAELETVYAALDH
jgi:hypothetical protein